MYISSCSDHDFTLATAIDRALQTLVCDGAPDFQVILETRVRRPTIVSAKFTPYHRAFMPDLAPPPPITLAALLGPGLAAVKKFYQPFLLLQSAAFLLVLGYYTSDRVRSLCEHLSQLKQHTGLIFSALSTALAGAILPELAKAIVMGDWQITRKRMRDVGFALAVFAVNGIITDFQYRGLAWWLGQDNHPATVIKKVLADQFITTPIYGVPYWVVVFSLRANRYDLIRTIRHITPRWYAARVLPLLIPAWCYWLPMVSLIYTLPGPLQFCLFCFAVAAWSLLMVFVATHEAEGDREARIEDGE